MGSSTLPLRILALAAAGASLAAVAARLLRRRRARPEQPPDAIRDAHCACGQAFRVTGAGRHEVFWVAGAAQDDPVLGQTCPSCGRALSEVA